MGFNIRSDARRTVVRDVPRGTTILGLVFVCSGLVVLTTATHGAQWSRFVLWERLSVVAIGVAHFCGGGWLVWRRLDTTTTFDHTTGEGVHVVKRPYVGEPTVTPFRLDAVRTIEIVRSEDSDGDPMYQLVLWLAGSRRLPLQLPEHGRARAESSRARLIAELGLTEAVALRSLRT